MDQTQIQKQQELQTLLQQMQGKFQEMQQLFGRLQQLAQMQPWVPLNLDQVQPLPSQPAPQPEEDKGILGGLFGMVKKTFGSASDLMGKTIQTGMNVAGSAAWTVVSTGSALAQGVGGAIQNNQGGSFMENAVGMMKDIGASTVSAWGQAISGAVDLGKTTVSSTVDMGKSAAWSVVSVVPGQFWWDMLQNAVDSVGTFADKAVNVTSSVTDSAMNIGSAVADKAGDVTSGMVNTATNLWSSVGNFISPENTPSNPTNEATPQTSTPTTPETPQTNTETPTNTNESLNPWSLGTGAINAVSSAVNTVSSGISTITNSVGGTETNEIQEGQIQTPTLNTNA